MLALVAPIGVDADDMIDLMGCSVFCSLKAWVRARRLRLVSSPGYVPDLEASVNLRPLQNFLCIACRPSGSTRDPRERERGTDTVIGERTGAHQHHHVEQFCVVW